MDNSEVMVVDANDVNISLTVYENKMLGYMVSMGLPVDGILVPISERRKLLKNFEDVVYELEAQDLGEARYISKFFTAATAGLFDAALNYMWDETVYQLRKRIANYDIEYFYDVAVSTEKRKKLSGVEDLCKLDDSELIQGAKEIDMISDVGYNHLDYIKYMRNWASAAHPNQTEITGLQLISWLETCIKEVINLPNSTVTIETGRFLKNIKSRAFTDEEFKAFTSFMGNLTVEKVNNIAAGLFGIYYRPETEGYVRDNVKRVFPVIWEIISEDTKNEFGIKYARFAVNGDSTEAHNARELLELVDGQAYFPEEIRVTELGNALDQLSEAHNGINNFYREPTFALQLGRVAGKKEIPSQINKKYVLTLTDCFITNGYGECWDADGIYKELIENYNQEQITLAAFTIMDEHIASMLQLKLCRKKYLEMISIIKDKNTSPVVGEIIDMIESRPDSLNVMRKDSMVKQQIETRKKILGLS